MADSKQYELIFLLRAQMDASLKQFSLVGGQIKELEQKIQQYNNTLKDIGAYKQQTAAINDYGQKLKQQETTLAEVTQKFNEATAAVKTAEQAYRQHQTTIDSLNLKIAEVKARIAELNAAMKQDGADTKALAQQKAECSAQLAKYNLQLQKEKQALQETKQKLNENRAAERELLEQKNQSQAAMDRLREKLAQEREKLTALSEALKKAGVDTKNLEEAEKSLAKQIQEATDEQERITEFANRVNDLADKFTVLKMAASGVQSAIRPVMDFFKDSLDAAAKLEYGMSSVQAVSGATAEETKQLTAVVKEMGATTIYTAEESSRAMQNMALAGWDAQQMISGLPAVIKLAAAAGEDLAEMTSIVSDGMNAFQLSGEAAAVKFADVLAKAATSSNTNVSLLGQSLSYVETTAGNLGYRIEDVSLALAAMANNALKGGVSGSALNTILTRMSGSNSTAAKQMEKMGLSMYYTVDAMGHAEGEAKALKIFLDELREAFKNFGDDAQAAQIAAYNLAGMRGMRGLLAIVNQSDEQWAKLTNEVYNYAGAADQISGIRMDNYTGQMYLLTSAWDALKTSVGEQFIPTATDALGVLTDITNGANDFVQNHGGIVRGIATITLTTLGLTAGVTGIATAVQAVRMALTALEVGKLLSVVGGFGGLLAISAAAGVAVAAFTSNVDDGVRAIKELQDAHRDAERAYQDSVASINGEADATYALIAQLRELSAQSERTEADQAKIAEIVDRLNTSIPELNLSYNKETDALTGLSGSVDDYVKSLYEAQRAERDIARSVELYGSIQETEKALAEAQEKLDKLLEQYKGLVESGGDLTGISNEIDVWRTKVYQLTEQLAAEREEYDALSESAENYYDAQENAADAETALQKALEATNADLGKLAEAYNEAYEAARESFEGQFSLFDEATADVEATVQAAQAALNTQLSFWQNYAGNIAALKEISAEDLGVTQENYEALMAYVRSGTPEAAGLAEDMVRQVREGKKEAVAALADTIGELKESQDLAAQYTADWTTGLTEQTEQLISDIEEEIGKLDMSEEAARYGRLTVQDYIDAANNMLPRVRAAYERVRLAAETALEGKTTSIILNGEYRVKSPADYIKEGNYFTWNGPSYANGTDWAPRGLALVGEKGPELVMMSGGERVIPAEQTARIMENGGNFRSVDDSVPVGTVNLNMKFEVSDNATPETVRALRDYSGEIEGVVRRVIREERIDARRRGFT